MDIALLIKDISAVLAGWPTLLFVIGVSILCTVALGFIQFRYFFYAFKCTLSPKPSADKKVVMTPIKAFVNTLSASLGNGSIAGMGTALYAGGPGAAFWVLVIGFIMMSVRFAEVFLSTHYASLATEGTTLGGPMLYLRKVPGGKILAYLYGFFCLFFGLVVGNAMQANSIRLSLETTWGVPHYVSAAILLAFVLYVTLGGAKRIVKVSDAIVPIKVGVFFVASFIVLVYHYQALVPALQLIWRSAFSPVAAVGGLLGFSVQQAIRSGLSRSVLATESGLGTAGILFGKTGSKSAVEDGIMSMVSTFISTIVCFLVALCIIVAGVWHSGAQSAELTIQAFNTVFGSYGGWVVSFLSITFGMGVIVAYAYITREAWLFLTGQTMAFGFVILYSIFAVGGAIAKVDMVWDLADITNMCMLLINLVGILFLLPVIVREVRKFRG